MSAKVLPLHSLETNNPLIEDKQEYPKPTQKYRKKHIPVAFREQIWLRDCGRVFDAKCNTQWCKNRITVWDFQAGHNIPESRGGPLTPENLVPICSRCNSSMGNKYTFTQWNSISKHEVPEVRFTCCYI